MSYVNLLANDVWSESDITNRGRAVIESQVSEARQNELRTIMLGHIAQMRTASPEELGEIMLVQALTEQAVLDNAAARADMALLLDVMEHERAIEWLSLPEASVHATITLEDGLELPNPAFEAITQWRNEARVTFDSATPEVLALYALRNPQPEPEEEVEVAP